MLNKLFTGKTYLAASLVDMSPETIFAFLSYAHQGTSCISVLHTLLFQLAEDNDDVKLVINMSNLKLLQRDSDYATKVFTDALKARGQTYIVIDGLDEIDEFDRRILLVKLCAIAADEPGVKLFVSCRKEHDIAKILQPLARAVSLDGRNDRCIEAYVGMRTCKWFEEAHFDHTSQSEIRGLLKPLGKKAEGQQPAFVLWRAKALTVTGMFLYARIVLDNVIMLYDVETIKDDLKALPTDLNEA